MEKCVILLSGGLDSAVMMAMARERGYSDICAISFEYGQRHKQEIKCAITQAIRQKATAHRIIGIDLGKIGGSALTDHNIEVPKDRHADGFAWSIPSTYVPARNTIFLSFALAWAEVLNAEDIFIGANALDFAGYPDCRTEFFQAFEKMANLSTASAIEGKLKFRVKAPLVEMSKKDIILEGARLKVDFSKTFSCYDPDDLGRSCGHCDSCKLRKNGFREAGIKDPIFYAEDDVDDVTER
jgi:7-cyano-7-deazaguanine synthase